MGGGGWSEAVRRRAVEKWCEEVKRGRIARAKVE